MNPAEAEQALERAAEPALAAIAEDSERAPAWLQPLFDAGAKHLFAPDLSLEQIQQAAGYRDPEMWTAFGQEVEQSPWDYFRDARLETAAHLLLETKISITEIGYLVGYSSPSTFRRPLQEFLGMPPSRYRRQAPRVLERAGTPPAGSQTNAYWERMLAGELNGAEARELDDYLARLTPAGGPATGGPAAGGPPAGETTDSGPTTGEPPYGGRQEDGGDGARSRRLLRTLAEGLLEVLETVESGEQGVTLSFAERRRLVRDAVVFPDGTLFEALSEHGRRVRRDNPGRGVELALLALDSLAARRILETDPALAALAWARLALARWHAGDLEAAAQDLERAANAVSEAGGEEPPAAWEAELCRVRAGFHWQRGQRLAALDLSEAMVIAQRAAVAAGAAGPGPRAPDAEGGTGAALLLRAELRAAAAELEPSLAGARPRLLRGALADVEEAHEAAPDLPPRLRRALVGLWTRLLVTIGNRGDRLAGLPQVARAADGLDGASPLLCWLEGHCSTDAEPLWRRAREGFVERGDELWAARLTLDLARLCLDRGRPGETAALASELASLLGGAAATPEDLAAIRPLSRAAPVTGVTAENLEAAERVLERLEWQRRARRALDLAAAPESVPTARRSDDLR